MKTVLLFLAFALLVTYLFISGQKRAVTEGYAGPEVGQPALNFNVKLDGATDLASMRGKVVLLDFWATWCGPCRESMPELERIYRAYRPLGFEIVAISNEDANKVKQFLKTVNTSYPVLIDREGKINMMYGISGYPNEILIDKNGRIAFQSTGFDEKGLQDAIDSALRG